MDQKLNQRPKAINDYLKLNGNKKLRRIIVSRKPVSAKIQYVANLVTLGGWTENMKKLNYDDVYHLFMLVELDDGTLFKLEKNSRVDITLNDNKLGDTMINIDNIDSTLNDMFNNAEQKYGLERIYRYDPFKTNCQMLLVDLISAINKITPELKTYIMQTASSLIESDVIKLIAKNITDGAASARYIYEGGSKPNNKKNKRKIRKNNN
jgi:hypothetical protein